MSATLDRGQLGKVLGMLGSNYDGEIANAGRAAHWMDQEAGTTWPAILSGAADRPVRLQTIELESTVERLNRELERARHDRAALDASSAEWR
jgi:hypothetical protein